MCRRHLTTDVLPLPLEIFDDSRAGRGHRAQSRARRARAVRALRNLLVLGLNFLHDHRRGRASSDVFRRPVSTAQRSCLSKLDEYEKSWIRDGGTEVPLSAGRNTNVLDKLIASDLRFGV